MDFLVSLLLSLILLKSDFGVASVLVLLML